jgi:hypothetical protein
MAGMVVRIPIWQVWWPGYRYGGYGGQDANMVGRVVRTPTWQVGWSRYQHSR